MNFAASNFSFFTLFLKADFVVKFVIIILIAASIYSWAIIIEKYKLFKKINGSSSIFEEQFWSSKSADSLYKKLEGYNEDPMANVFKAGMDFMIKNKSRSASNQERVLQALSGSIDKEMEVVEKKLTFLATVGSTAPFIGLFGTVWGIMNSFQSIAISKNTSLAIVAPGIAEALFATALGLLAAIPAVVAYNKFTSDSRKYSTRLENFSQSFISIT
ncbi:MAG: protein TolQ [Proteobacteria bacterium]|jgi:biopolymer transport protein TolQ|nr:protein TolQ [Candidatus Fonsibacter sp.]NBV93540.1 protein TolQ [Candidatus Fonsibacter sp. PEL4]NBZ97615.1 protein TolQ [Candidatus Fonsibacter sp. PEL4]